MITTHSMSCPVVYKEEPKRDRHSNIRKPQPLADQGPEKGEDGEGVKEFKFKKGGLVCKVGMD